MRTLRPLLIVAGLALGLAARAEAARLQGGRVDPPVDVVVLVADDLGWGDVFPHVPTPNLERLASAGVVFRRAYSMPVCAPSRYCALFGRYGRRDGLGAGTYQLEGLAPPMPALEIFSLPEIFTTLGYSTAAFGKWHVEAPSTPSVRLARAHGFQSFRAGTPGNLGKGPRAYYSWTRIDDGEKSDSQTYTTIAVRDAFLEWWQATAGPRFAWVAFHAPHDPFNVPPPELLPDGYPEPVSGRERYESLVVALDHAIGDILDALDRERTLVVFLSDNGTPVHAAPPGQASRVKGTTFEGGVNVPVFVSGPGVPAGVECTGLVHLVDLMATLAEYTGFELPKGAAPDSISFARMLRDPGASAPRDHVFFERFGEEEGQPSPLPEDDLAVRTATHKLRISVRDGQQLEQLFDLLADPLELHPLDPFDPAQRALYEQLRKLLAALPPRKSP